MPTQLNRQFTLDWRGRPPHMLSPDIPVWYRFLEKWGEPFQKLYYDCCLGGPEMSEIDLQDPIKRAWRDSLSKRADAIAELENEVWIIEVTSVGGLRALGQLQTYRTLWLRDPKINKIEKMVLVAERIDEDILEAMAIYGVMVFLV